MREIKFRGKPFGRKEFVYGSYVYMPWVDNNTGAHFIYPHEKCIPDNIEIDPDTVGQFTGIIDNNGNDIYEGDIIENIDSKGNPIRHKIVYADCSYRAIFKTQFGFTDCSLSKRWIDECSKTVIGNIHDNPELL